MITAVDTNILIDILEPDPIFGPASREALKQCTMEGAICACEVVWAEILSVYADAAKDVAHALQQVGLSFSPMVEEAALEAAACWHRFREKGGKRDRIVADFLIGGHAFVQCDLLLTRDRGFFREYFQNLRIVSPTA